MRNGGPQARRGEPGLLTGGVEDADDPGGPLVGRGREAEAGDQRGVGGEAGDRHRPGVGDVREQGAERDDELGAERFDELDDHRRERAPPERRLAPREQNQVTRCAGDAGFVELDRGPLDLARPAVGQLDPRPGRLEVVELLGVDRREPAGRQRAADERDRTRSRVGRVVPALERAYHRRGPEAVGAVLPLQRLHPVHRTSWGYELCADRQRASAGRRGQRRVRLHAQGSPDHAERIAVPGARAPRSDRHRPGAGVPRGGRARRPLRPWRSGPGGGQGRALPRRAGAGGGRHQPRRGRRRRRRSGRIPAHRVPRSRRARRLPRAPRARGVRRPTTGPCSTHCCRTGTCGRRGGGRRARGRGTTRISEGCSSTRSRSGRSPRTCASSTSG